ncbi:hypothetical protein DXG03_004478 [Asterophora parasitica]|uniref:GYF domain-containing protein n=1 Tax=Asterophora parasitica TaxID=117018 RepID=A0A9P7GB18_9AGAR|nr:hypothetical protein DXG03_004478 [Asterophora parasitica]
MHFGPEWMRTKHQTPTRSQPPPSPPPAAPPSGASTYSALVSPAPPQQPEKRDEAHPFRYSKEDLLRIYREGGGKGGLGLEVERWEGVVREVGSEPVGLREMGDAEKKQSLSNLQPSPRDVAPSPRRGPGFDGIMGSGESWVARRRASEASLKSGGGTLREGVADYQTDGKASDIREEEEDASHAPEEHPHSARNLSASDRATGEADRQDSTAAEMARLFSGPNVDGVPASTPATPDLTSVEWSYKDPSGQIQGPFNALVMQKWFDDGYFTGDLPMKRTHLDTQWATVDELVKRHGGSTKIFVTPPPRPVAPPGLAHRDSQNHPQDPLLYNGPYQPAPLRNLRSSTLDSFGSNASDSPSSSFGAGRFGNGSPDPNAFGGRGAYFGDSSIGGRAQAFGTIPDPAAAFNRRNAFNDPSIDPSLSMRSPAFGNIIPGRGPTVDGFPYNRTYSPGQGWNAATAFDGANGNRGSMDSFPSPFGPASTNNFGNLGHTHDVFGDGPSFQNVDYSHYVNGPSQSQHFSPATQYQQPATNAYLQGVEPHTISSDPNHSPALPQSPWNNDVPPARRPGPFEVAHPTSANTVVVQPVVEASPWGQASEPSRPSSQANGSSWMPPQGSFEENWKASPAPDSLTAFNIGQHNQQQQQLASAEVTASKAESSEPSVIVPILDAAPAAPEPVAKAAPAKLKAKATAPATQPSLTPKVSPPTPQVVLEPSPPPPAPKAAWSKEEEKTKPSGVSVSLRDIQEAEAKKAEARKVAEREKERASRAAAPVIDTMEGAQPFTAPWGLPTSQAGARASAPAKESPSSASPATPPVWTTAPKPAATKKTMKEIQEEEEKRKKNANKETAASAARRAYADTTQKVAPPPSTSQGAWTTVGPSGKANAVTAPPRPVITPSSSSLNVPSSSARTNGNAVPRPVSVSPVVKAAPLARNDEPVPPSHEFVKWLSGSLKGLNSSVNVEEIMQMLLSFSMDPDPSTVELISELIYANSTTLDGRRFAAEFISKRKADAAARPKGAAGTKTTAKPVSIADVVKAAPKPAQSEWGFKVVNKKKKGGRA